MADSQIKTITVDGTEHDLTTFPPEVQKLVAIHQNWEGKLVEKRLEMAMIEAAVRDLTRELTGKIKEALEAPVAEEAVEVVAEEVTETPAV